MVLAFMDGAGGWYGHNTDKQSLIMEFKSVTKVAEGSHLSNI